jgi:hypothetical protein
MFVSCRAVPCRVAPCHEVCSAGNVVCPRDYTGGDLLAARFCVLSVSNVDQAACFMKNKLRRLLYSDLYSIPHVCGLCM